MAAANRRIVGAGRLPRTRRLSRLMGAKRLVTPASRDTLVAAGRSSRYGYVRSGPLAGVGFIEREA